MEYSRIVKDSNFSNISVIGKVVDLFKQYKSVNISSNMGNINVFYEGVPPEVGVIYYFMICQFKNKNISIIKDFIKV